MERRKDDIPTGCVTSNNTQQGAKIDSDGNVQKETFTKGTQEISSNSALTKNNLNSETEETAEEVAISHLKSYKLYKDAKEYLRTEGGRLCKKIGTIYNIEVYKREEDKPYYLNVDLKNRPGSINIGKHPDAEATIITRDDVVADILSKKLHPATALVQRKVIVKGKLTAIVKFKPEFFGIKPKL